MDLILSGEVSSGAIDEFVEAWHQGESDLDLADYLGMSSEEYRLFVKDESNLSRIIAARGASRVHRITLSSSRQRKPSGLIQKTTDKFQPH